VVSVAAVRAKEVAEQQERDKAESEARRSQEQSAAAAILAGALDGSDGPLDPDAAAAAILGAPTTDKASESRVDDILGGR
jgi:hypothetical protein